MGTEKNSDNFLEDVVKNLVSDGLNEPVFLGRKMATEFSVIGKYSRHELIVLKPLSFLHFIHLIGWGGGGGAPQMSLWICCHTLAPLRKYLLSSHILQVTGKNLMNSL